MTEAAAASPLDALRARLRRIAALEQVSGLLDWDQEAAMPPKGAAQRAEQAGALAATIHAAAADPALGDLIAALEGAALPPEAAADLREAARLRRHAARVPAALAEALARETAAAHSVWAEARAARRFAGFAPALGRIVALKREEAAALAEGEGPEAAYEALLDGFEPGAKVAKVAALLEGLRPRLSALRAALAERPAPPAPTGRFPAGRQLRLARRVAARLGYDLAAGRIDTVVHPFSSGVGGDVRITTRADPAEPFGCLYSTIHEVGHALYSQGAPDAFLPHAQYASMAAHESQSRFWENWIGRSRPFMDWLFPEMRRAFGDFGVDGPEALYAAANRVETGFIRTEADEVHYNLHVILRFDLERALIGGGLGVGDLEAAWNDRFRADFGREPPHAGLGVLQDVHWSAGLFGYFPTYTLGNVFAACLDAAMRREMPERDELVAAGEFGAILGWMRTRIHARGRLLPAAALIEAATGAPPSAEPLLAHLEAKFGAMHGL